MVSNSEGYPGIDHFSPKLTTWDVPSGYAENKVFIRKLILLTLNNKLKANNYT